MKLAFLVQDLGSTQLAYRLISQINKSTKERDNLDIVVFYENLVKPCIAPGFMITNIADCWSFNGAIVSTSLSTAHKLLNVPSARRKFFYSYDLEWIRYKDKSYEDMARIYCNKNLKLIARSKSHKDMLSMCWNRDVNVIHDFNIEEFLKLVNGVNP